MELTTERGVAVLALDHRDVRVLGVAGAAAACARSTPPRCSDRAEGAAPPAESAPPIGSGLNHAYGSGELRKQILFDVSTTSRPARS